MAEHFLGKEKVPGSNPGVGSQFNSTVSLHVLVDFFSPEVRQGNASPQGVLYPNEVWQANVIKDMKEILCAKEEN